jgi:hypothetical protein
MEVITKEKIDKCNQLFMEKDKIDFDNFLLLSKISQGHLWKFITEKSKLLRAVKRHESTFQMLWVVMRCFKGYKDTMPLISAALIDLYESKWYMRMRSHRSYSQEDLMTYIKTEIHQPFLVEYVMNTLHEEGSLFEIKDHDLLLKTYSVFFAIIELMDEEISKGMAA